MKIGVVSGVVLIALLSGCVSTDTRDLEKRVAEMDARIEGVEKRLVQAEEELKSIMTSNTRNPQPVRGRNNPETEGSIYKYRDNHSGITITDYIRGELAGRVVFPSEIDGKTVTEIAAKAFYYNEDITHVVVPASITHIGRFTFSSCKNLSAIEVDPDNPCYTSANGILFSKDMKELIQVPYLFEGDYVIPHGVEELGWSAFKGCNITSLTIPATTVKSETHTFGNLPRMTAFIVAEENPGFAAVDGVLFNKEMTRLIAFPEARGGEYAVPEGVEVLGCGAFARNENIECVHLPNTLKTIERDVFLKCSKLTEIELPESLESIQPLSFSLSGIKQIHLPKNVSEIGSIAFRSCKDLTVITIDEDNPYFTVLDQVIYSKDLTKLVLCLNSKQGAFEVPDTVTTIGPWPFDSCNDLAAIHLPMTLEKLENGAFIRAGGLDSIVIPPKVEALEYYSFLGCKDLNWILFLGDAPKLGRNAFMGCPDRVKIYYKATATGFTTPVWNGMEARPCSEEKVQELIKENRSI